MKRSNMSQGVAIVAFVACGVLGLVAPYHLPVSVPKSTTGPPARVTAPLATSGTPDYRELAAQNAPAVVGIAAAPRTTGVGQVGSVLGRGVVTPTYSPNDPFFRFFHYLPISHATVRADSLGSGFIISTDGVILTNAHLVRDAGRVAVMLADRRKFEANILGIDLLTDVAVLKIDARNLPTVRLGNSKDLVIGDSVLVLGHPYGLEENAAFGTVRATGRSASLVPFIRTDVAAHLGDSGGPLVDTKGRVVGISAQISTAAAGYDRVSYAIPINVALRVENEVARTDGRAQLGIEFESLTPSLVSVFRGPDISGSLITRVMP
jgi:serine protease Do